MMIPEYPLDFLLILLFLSEAVSIRNNMRLKKRIEDLELEIEWIKFRESDTSFN